MIETDRDPGPGQTAHYFLMWTHAAFLFGRDPAVIYGSGPGSAGFTYVFVDFCSFSIYIFLIKYMDYSKDKRNFKLLDAHKFNLHSNCILRLNTVDFWLFYTSIIFFT